MTEIPLGLCQPCSSGRYSLLLGPKLEIHLKSDVLRLGNTSLCVTRKLLGFSRHILLQISIYIVTKKILHLLRLMIVLEKFIFFSHNVMCILQLWSEFVF